jgi:hypothetical protein
MSEDLRRELLRVNELDAELWDCACELLDKRIENYRHLPAPLLTIPLDSR